MLKKFLKGLAELAEDFKFIWIYKTTIPFFGYEQMFTIATDDASFNPLSVAKEEIDEMIRERIRGPLHQFSDAVYHGAFALSPYSKREIRAVLGDKFPQFNFI